MKQLICRFILFASIASMVYSQENYCLYFPLTMGMTWEYVSDTYPYSKTAVISDTMSFNNHFYYKYGPYGANNPASQYWLRPFSNTILALNPADSSEYLLFNYSYDGPTTWNLPPVITPPYNQPVNQCDWGTTISTSSSLDSVVTSNRTFYYPRGFAHGERPCWDAGIASTRFSRDFGLVKFFQITEGDGIDWSLVTPVQDTISVSARITTDGNPCLTVPCLPGISATLRTPEALYFLTHQDILYREATILWGDISCSPGDSIVVRGMTTARQDVWGEAYQTLEIISLEHAQTSGVSRESGSEKPEKELLLHNYPNPFNPVTNIEYYLSVASAVKLTIFDLHGREVKVLDNQTHPAGKYFQRWDGQARNGQPAGAGLYLVRLETSEQSAIRKILLLQ